jgi:Xaa-Pro aminopeptidase
MAAIRSVDRAFAADFDHRLGHDLGYFTQMCT